MLVYRMDDLKITEKDADQFQALLASDSVVKNVVTKVSAMQALPNSALNQPITTKKNIKITQRLIEEAYAKLRGIVQNKTVGQKNITIMIAYAMQIANEMLVTSKVYKVELTLAIIRQLINDEVHDPSVRMILHSIVEVTVPHLIGSIDDLPGFIQKYLCCTKSKNPRD